MCRRHLQFEFDRTASTIIWFWFPELVVSPNSDDANQKQEFAQQQALLFIYTYMQPREFFHP